MAELNSEDGHGQREKLCTTEKNDDLLYTLVEKKKINKTVRPHFEYSSQQYIKVTAVWNNIKPSFNLFGYIVSEKN